MTKNPRAASSPRPEAQRLRTAIRALVRRFSISERADIACCGMTVAQAATLEALSDGSLRSVELGRRLGISPSTLSRNLDRLEDRGLVSRTADGADGRAFKVELTSKGRRAAAEVSAGEETFAASILEQLPAAERQTVVEQLERLLTAVREATESCCPGAFDHLMKDCPAPNGSHSEE